MAEYKQPRRLNAVSLTLVVIAGLATWLGVSAWPVLSQYADVKTELEDALPRLYHANLSPDPDGSSMTEEVRQHLLERLARLAIPEAAKNLVLTRNAKVVSIGIAYPAIISLRGTQKHYQVTLSPRVETSAERVKW